MRKARKTSYHHGRLREALIEAALGLVKEQGALALSLAAAWWLALNLHEPLHQTIVAAKKIASGDLAYPIRVTRRDELADVLQAIKMVQARLATVMGQLQESAAALATATDEVANASAATHELMDRQHQETDLVATAMNEMSATVAEVARNTVAAATAANDASTKAQAGHQLARDTVAMIQALATEVETAAEAIARLGQDAESIGGIVDTIHGIADQTNLLALNAAIEAARAGEQGRGFAVVADEVRALARRTQQSTQEIQAMIQRLQEGARQAVAVMNRGRAQAEDSVGAVRATGTALDDIRHAVNTISDMNTQIATAAEEQSAVGEEMNRNVFSIRDLSENTLASTDRVVHACANLDQLAKRLDGLVNQYRR